MQKFVRIVNFEQTQHYKDRTPPWIRLYNELLDSYQYCCLPDASKAHAVGLMLLASRLENRIVADPKYIGAKISSTEPVDLGVLERAGFIEIFDENGEIVSGCYQDARPEQSRAEQSREISFAELPGWPKTPPDWQTVRKAVKEGRAHPCAELWQWFEILWERYPARNGKKAGKAEAWEKIFKLRPNDETKGRIQAKLDEDINSQQWLEGFVPDMHRWIATQNKNGWELDGTGSQGSSGGHYAQYNAG